MQTSAEITHHIDCDGYRFAHMGRVRTTWHSDGRVPLHQSYCEKCAWTGMCCGDGGVGAVEREASAHTSEVRCSGECQSWEE